MEITKRKFTASLIVVLLIGIVCSASVFASLPTSTLSLSSGAYPNSGAYSVFALDNMVYVKDRYGSIVQSETNLTQADTSINYALSNLASGRDYQETVNVFGNLTIAHTLLVEEYTVLHLEGKITLANNADCNMLELKNLKGWMVEINGGIWDGNGANQGASEPGFNSTGTGFYLYYIYASAKRGETLIVQNLVITQCKVDCLYIHRQSIGAAIPIVSNVQLDQPQGDDFNSFGLHLEIVHDGLFHNLRNVDRVRIDNVGFCTFSDMYVNTVMNISNSYILNFNAISYDTATYKIFMFNVDNSTFNNFICDVIGNSSAIEEAVALFSCNYNNFNNFNVGHFGYSYGTNYFQAGIWETTGSSYNNFNNIIAPDSTYAAVMINNATYPTLSNATNIIGGIGYYNP